MQTTYNLEQANAVLGQMVDAYDVANDVNMSAAATTVIPFGRGICLSTRDYITGMKAHLVGMNDVELGGEGQDDSVSVMVSVRDLQRVTGQYEIGDTACVGLAGKYWVETETEVTAQDLEEPDVWVRVNGVVGSSTITIDADLITGNIITATVNGTVCTSAMANFADDHDATMADFAAKIAAAAGISTAVLEGGDNYEVTITADSMGGAIAITAEGVSGGVTQPGMVVAVVTAGIPLSSCGIFRQGEDITNAGTTASCGFVWLAAHAVGMAPVMAVPFGGEDEGEPQV